MVLCGFSEAFEVPKKAEQLPRFSMLVCGMFCSLVISATYAFSLLTDKLQNSYGYTQNDITTVSTVGYVVGYLTFPFGIIYDFVGPKPVFGLGIIMSVLGTVLFALSFNGTISHSVAAVSIINAIMNLGCGLFDMGSILTVLSWFPLDRGLVVACMKTSTGLGSSIVSTLYNTFFIGKEENYMFFLAGMSTFLGLIALVLFYLPPFHMTGLRERQYTEETRQRVAEYLSVYMRHKGPIKRFVYIFVLVACVWVVVTVRSVTFVFIDEPTMSQKLPPTIITIILYLCLVAALFPLKWFDKQPSGYDAANAKGHAEEMGETDAEAADQTEMYTREPAQHKQSEDRVEGEPSVADAGDENAPKKGPQPGTKEHVLELLRQADEFDKISPQFPTGFFYNMRRPTLWCLWISGFCIASTVLVVVVNSTQIYVAVSGNPEDKQRPSLYVAIMSIGSAVGRVSMAFFEVGTQSKPPEKRITLTIAYCVPPALCILACLLFLVVPAPVLLAPMLLVGLANGVYAAAEVLTVRTVFSIDVAKHYNSLFFVEMLSVIFMNRLLLGEIMTKNSVERIVYGSPSLVCIDRKKCIQTPFIVLLCLAVVGLVSSAIMHITYLRFCNSVNATRREERRALEDQLLALEAAEAQGDAPPAECDAVADMDDNYSPRKVTAEEKDA